MPTPPPPGARRGFPLRRDDAPDVTDDVCVLGVDPPEAPEARRDICRSRCSAGSGFARFVWLSKMCSGVGCQSSSPTSPEDAAAVRLLASCESVRCVTERGALPLLLPLPPVAAVSAEGEDGVPTTLLFATSDGVEPAETSVFPESVVCRLGAESVPVMLSEVPAPFALSEAEPPVLASREPGDPVPDGYSFMVGGG